MMETIMDAIVGVDLPPNALLLAAIGAGVFIAMVSITAALSPDPVSNRMRAIGRRAAPASAGGPAILRPTAADPSGLDKVFVPEDEKERSAIRRQLESAGFRGPNAVRDFFVLRFLVGVALPAVLLLVFFFRGALDLPGPLAEIVMGVSRNQVLFTSVILLAVGFYGPQLWLRHRMAARQRRIEENFPNTLDLLQISLEAGMGLDPAIDRVAREMAPVAPEISEEFLTLQSEIMAGRDRESALFAMAQRLGIDDAMAVANVIVQSQQYGSSVSEALMTYSEEMRIERELRAQEKANKLPVQMSGVIAGLMLPVLLLITLGPVVIRVIRVFGEM